jgi:hypothetical protein
MEYLQPAGSQPARAAAKGEPGQRTRRYERSRLRLFPLPGERRRGPTRRGFPARPDSSRASSACRHPAADGKPWRAARFRAESSRGLSRGRRRTQRTSGDGVGRTVPSGGPAKMCQPARGAFSWRVVPNEVASKMRQPARGAWIWARSSPRGTSKTCPLAQGALGARVSLGMATVEASKETGRGVLGRKVWKPCRVLGVQCADRFG